MIYNKNKVNGIIIDYDLLGRVLDAKNERINYPVQSKNKILAIKTTVNPNWYEYTSQEKRMFWMQKTKEHLEKLSRETVLPEMLG